jgi:hypothetical protein
LLASGSHEWSSMLARALSPQENTSERRTARQQVAARYDWDLLVEKLAGTLAGRLGLAFPNAVDSRSQTCESLRLTTNEAVPH